MVGNGGFARLAGLDGGWIGLVRFSAGTGHGEDRKGCEFEVLADGDAGHGETPLRVTLGRVAGPPLNSLGVLLWRAVIACKGFRAHGGDLAVNEGLERSQ